LGAADRPPLPSHTTGRTGVDAANPLPVRERIAYQDNAGCGLGAIPRDHSAAEAKRIHLVLDGWNLEPPARVEEVRITYQANTAAVTRVEVEQFPDRQVADEAPPGELNESGEDEKSDQEPRGAPCLRDLLHRADWSSRDLLDTPALCLPCRFKVSGLAGAVRKAPDMRRRGGTPVQMTRENRRASSSLVIAVGLLLGVCACGSIEHGYTLQRYQGQMLSVPAGPGLERLRIERNYDPTIDTYVSQNGLPDSMYVADGLTVQLFYVQQDLVATFQRSTLSSKSRVAVSKGVPELAKRARSRAEAPGEAHSMPQDAGRAAVPTAPTGRVSAGTCFAVRPDGYLITSNHIVQGASSTVVHFPDGDVVEARVLKQDPQNDVALLKVSRATPTFLKLGRANAAELGDRLFTVGFPVPSMLGVAPKYSEGTLSSKSGVADVPTLIQVSVPVQPGNSGGPLLTDGGQVVGIVAAQAAVEAFYGAAGTLPQNVNWAVKAEYVSPLFDAVTGPDAPEGSRRQVIAHVERAVCLVLARG
jgi:S1-C subfamily serine protease